jgi:hypothetical protein
MLKNILGYIHGKVRMLFTGIEICKNDIKIIHLKEASVMFYPLVSIFFYIFYMTLGYSQFVLLAFLGIKCKNVKMILNVAYL